MSLQESQAEKENKRTSAIVTGVLTVLMLITLFYPFISFATNDEISGVVVNLGTLDAESFGEETGAAPSESEDTAEESVNESEDLAEAETEQPPEPIAAAQPDKPKETPLPKDVAKDNNPESVNMEKEDKDKEKAEQKAKEEAREKAEAKKKAEAEAKRKAEEEAKKKAEEERRRKEKELKDKKNELSDLFGGGDGDDASTTGDEEGEPDRKNISGISTGTGDIGGGLSGRELVDKPTIKDNSQATGKVVVKVCVDDKGKVISAEFTQKGSDTNDAGLINTAVKGAKKYKFSPSAVDKQCGTITFEFKVR